MRRTPKQLLNLELFRFLFVAAQGVPTNWPDRLGAVGRGLLRFGSLMREKAEFAQI